MHELRSIDAELQLQKTQFAQQQMELEAQNAELKAEIKIQAAALQAKDAFLQNTIHAKDSILQATIQEKHDALQASAVALQAKDAEICRLQAELARRDVEPAVRCRAQRGPARAIDDERLEAAAQQRS